MPDFGGAAPPSTVAAADFERFAAKVRNPGLAGKLAGGLVGALFEDPRAIAAFFRRFRPIAHVPFFRPNPPHRGFWLITRYDDVMEVLSRDRDFPVPFETAFRELDPTHENFLLGMADDDSYRAIHAETMKAFRLEDIPAIGAFSAARAEQLVEAGGGEIDAIGGLLTQVPTEIIGRYYGIPAQDPNFAIWLIAMNLHSFPHLVTSPAAAPAALAAAAHMGPLVDAAIARAKQALDPAHGRDPGTILGRFVQAQRSNPVLTDDVIRATIIGCMLGFVPTNNRASGQILRCLLKFPPYMAKAEAAARSGDDDLLERVLFEALRFRPINPGPFRLVAHDTYIAAGLPRERKVPKGAMLMVATHSASFDPRQVAHPNTFDIYRDLSDTMRFGWGQHFCIGYRIAVEQIAQTFKPLLLRGNIRPVRGRLGRPQYYGGFYEHLYVRYG